MMTTSAPHKPITLIVQESEAGPVFRSMKRSDKLKLRDHNTILLDVNGRSHKYIILINIRSAGIDLNTIHSLNLSHCCLNYFPDAFGDLNMHELNLSHNKLMRVPKCIENGLSSLTMLDLSHNALRYFINQPRCVRNLRILRLSNNYLNKIPDWVWQVHCYNLEELYYSGNRITNRLNQSRFRYQSSYKLKKLELKNCSFRSKHLHFLIDIDTLTVLDLSNEYEVLRNSFPMWNQFQQLFEHCLWEDLKILCLNNLAIPYLPDEITQLSLLEELYLSHNNLMYLPYSFGLLVELKILDVSHNRINDIPRSFTDLENLEIFWASYNSIRVVPDFSIMKIKVLDLYHNHMDLTVSDIKIDSIVTKIDLEQNYLDSTLLNIPGYLEMKNNLRLEIADTSRLDGLCKEPYICKYPRIDWDSSYSDWDSDSDQGSSTFTKSIKKFRHIFHKYPFWMFRGCFITVFLFLFYLFIIGLIFF